jgi:hypothetical protein
MTTMAYDQELVDRMRELVGDRSNLTEQKMFGGLAFLISGNMARAHQSLIHPPPADGRSTPNHPSTAVDLPPTDPDTNRLGWRLTTKVLMAAR